MAQLARTRKHSLSTRLRSCRRTSAESGASMLEFTVVTPALFLLVFGVIHFCNVWQVKGFLEATAMRTLSAAATSQDDVEHSQIGDEVRTAAERKAEAYFKQWYKNRVAIDTSSIKLRFPGEPDYYVDSLAFPSGGDAAEDLKSLPMVLTMTARVPSVVPMFPSTTVQVRASAFRELLQARNVGRPLSCFTAGVNPADWAAVIRACECDPANPPVSCEGLSWLNSLTCQCQCPQDPNDPTKQFPMRRFGDTNRYFCSCPASITPPGTEFNDAEHPWIPTRCPSAGSGACPSGDQRTDPNRCCRCFCPNAAGQDSYEAPVQWSDGKLHCGCENPGGAYCCPSYTTGGQACPNPEAPFFSRTVAGPGCKCECPAGTIEMNPTIYGATGTVSARKGCCRKGETFDWDSVSGTGRCQACPEKVCPEGKRWIASICDCGDNGAK